MVFFVDVNGGSVEGGGMEYEKGRKFSVEEVVVYKNMNDVWIVVDGEVYDVMVFLEIYFGGVEVSREFFLMCLFVVNILNLRSYLRNFIFLFMCRGF